MHPQGLARPGHLPGKGERAGVEVPHLQDADDRLEVIGVADEVGAAPAWRVRWERGLGGWGLQSFLSTPLKAGGRVGAGVPRPGQI